MFTNIFYDRNRGIVHLWDDTEGYSKFRPKRYAYRRTNDITEYKDIFGNYVEKVYNFDEGDELLESDVSIETRVLIDKYYNHDDNQIAKNNVLVFDIEIDVDKSFPDINKAANVVTAIATYDYNTDEYVCLVLDEEGQLTENTNGNVRVIPFTNEPELLMAFIQLINHYKPTILTGWNIGNFDIPYLIRRMHNVIGEENTNDLSPIKVVRWSDFKQSFEIAGISQLDYLVLYKKFTFSEERNYRLDTIGKKELGYGKIEYEGSLKDLFNTDINKYIEYNINDVKLVKEINDKKKLIDSAVTICTIGKVKYDDIEMSSRYIDGAILTYLKRKNLVAPNKKQKSEKVKFEGAYVKEPKPGLYPFVYDLDLTSLYPSIIMSLNISPETKSAKVLNWDNVDMDDDECKVQLYSFSKNSVINIDVRGLKNMLTTYKIYISSNGILYKSKEHVTGIIPDILDKWFSKRIEYKNEMKRWGKAGDKKKYEFYDNMQYAQKVLLNSVYGVLGLNTFRWYDLDNAIATTASGQVIIKNAQASANKYYNEYNTKYEIELENSKTLIKRGTDKIKIKRNNDVLEILLFELKDGDEII